MTSQENRPGDDAESVDALDAGDAGVQPVNDTAADDESNAHAEDVEDDRKPRLPAWAETVLTVLVVLVVVGLFQNLIGRQYVIPSASMEPTLHGCPECTDDRIFVEKVSYYFSDPQPGDVVVFEGTPSWAGMYQSPRSDNALLARIQDGLSLSLIHI